MRKNVCSKYCGLNTEDIPRSGVKWCLKGPRTTVVTITDHYTDEDSETAGLAAKLMIDTFMKRPSLEDRAMEGITQFVNDHLSSSQKENRYEDGICAFAAVFILRGKARWVTGGGSMVYHFADRQLIRYSQCVDAPPLGMTAQYSAELEDAFDLSEGENAFLICSKEMAKQTPPELLEQTLENADSAEAWLQAIVNEIGESRQYCASTMILPAKKRFGWRKKREEE